MAYLIDGNNLIGHTSNYRLNDIRSKYGLILKLIRFQKIKKSKITIVFDGTPDISLDRLNYNPKKFSIIFSESVSADTKIKEILSTKKYLRDIYVVSSDRELIDFVKNKGAKVIKCSDFNKLIRKTFKETKKENSKQEIKLTPLEVKHWSEVFKRKR